MSVTSGFPRCSTLGPVMVITYITYIDEHNTCTALIFADDLKTTTNFAETENLMVRCT